MSAIVGRVLRLFSCYAPLSMSLVEFKRLIGHVEARTVGHRGIGVDVIVAGDFNAHFAI